MYQSFWCSKQSQEPLLAPTLSWILTSTSSTACLSISRTSLEMSLKLLQSLTSLLCLPARCLTFIIFLFLTKMHLCNFFECQNISLSGPMQTLRYFLQSRFRRIHSFHFIFDAAVFLLSIIQVLKELLYVSFFDFFQFFKDFLEMEFAVLAHSTKSSVFSRALNNSKSNLWTPLSLLSFLWQRGQNLVLVLAWSFFKFTF